MSRRFELKYHHMSEQSILIQWPEMITEEVLDDIIRVEHLIKNAHTTAGLHTTPAYASLLIHYPSRVQFEKEEKILHHLYRDTDGYQQAPPKSWTIPVCYDPEFGIDQPNFEANGITKQQLVDAHTAVKYRIFMIGFLPGFLYLGPLPKLIHLPRKSSPSLHVPSGSVAIGDQQTGIYPIDSPGGWHVIGRTPIQIFDVESKSPTMFHQGDYLSFYAIDRIIYEKMFSSISSC